MTESETLFALAMIDSFLADTKHNSLIDGDRVRDALLDIRSALTQKETP